MDGCRKERRRLLDYIDGELASEEAMAFERHIEECPDCAAFLARARRLDEALEETLAPALDASRNADFLKTLEDRLRRRYPAGSGSPAAAGLRPRHGPARRILAAAGAVAAVLLLLWFFPFSPDGTAEAPGKTKENPGTGASPAPIAEAQQKSGAMGAAAAAIPFSLPPLPAIDGKARLAAHREFRALLADIGALAAAGSCVHVPDRAIDGLIGPLFEVAAAPLRSRGWRVGFMLSSALKEAKGPALAGAVRLSRLLSKGERAPDTASALADVLAKGKFPAEAMRSLAAVGGPTAERTLGRFLSDAGLRSTALASLAAMGGAGPARRIEEALRGSLKRNPPRLSPFDGKALEALSRMGRPGLEAILEVFSRSGCSRALARALPGPNPELYRLLAESLPSLKGSLLRSGLELAALYRLEEALPILEKRARTTSFEGGDLSLMAAIGGPKAAADLVLLYEEPLSLSARRKIAAALAGLFALHPGEREKNMEGCLGALGPLGGGHGEVLVEMLSLCPEREACRALAWVVENRAGLARQAALGLARTDSPDALALLADVLRRGRLDPRARAAATAAVFYLGGGKALDAILKEGPGEKTAGTTPFLDAAQRGLPLRPERLTDSKFRKIQEYLTGGATP